MSYPSSAISHLIYLFLAMLDNPKIAGAFINQMSVEIFCLFITTLLDFSPTITHGNILKDLKDVCGTWKECIESNSSFYTSMLLNTLSYPVLNSIINNSFGPKQLDLAWCIGKPINNPWGHITQWELGPMSLQVFRLQFHIPSPTNSLIL
jgi:hypothetical protein